MKLATFNRGGAHSVEIVERDTVMDLGIAWRRFGKGEPPADILDLIVGGPAVLDAIHKIRDTTLGSKDDVSLWTPLPQLRLDAPIPQPRKNVFCVGRNYKDHIEEGARARGATPVFPVVLEFFSKPPTAVIGHEHDIRLDPKLTQKFEYEVELRIVIGRTARDIASTDVNYGVFGYTIVNDVSARDLQTRHGQWFKGKGLDTTCPIGPWIVMKDEFGDPSGHRITLWVNGITRQDSNTADMLFDCATIVASLSEGLTIEPGDIIATGTPSGVALGMSPQQLLKDGDVIEAEIAGTSTAQSRAGILSIVRTI